MPCKFNSTRQELALIGAIVQRARDVTPSGAAMHSALDLVMSMDACHSNGCRLDLQRMTKASRIEDVAHDVFGIHRYIDKETGKLTDCFLPRFHQRKGL